MVTVDYPDLLSPKVAPLNRTEFLTKGIDQIRGTGYAVDALEAALWCFWHTNSFEEAVLRASNRGDDADTTAAIVGQIAGAWYGVNAIPAGWRDKVAMGDEIFMLADRLLEKRQS